MSNGKNVKAKKKKKRKLVISKKPSLARKINCKTTEQSILRVAQPKARKIVIGQTSLVRNPLGVVSGALVQNCGLCLSSCSEAYVNAFSHQLYGFVLLFYF